MPNQKWVVHKFGGTSVGKAERYKGVAEIIQKFESKKNLGIVVSAMKGVTDALIKAVELARQGNESHLSHTDQIKTLHFSESEKLLTSAAKKQIHDVLEKDFEKIKDILRGVFLARSAAENIIELISGYGEVWSAQFLSAYLNEKNEKTSYLDAREVLVVESKEQRVVVDWKSSKIKLEKYQASHPNCFFIITGFVAATSDGVPTTLKRNGSDFSASIFGSLLEAKEIYIWTDVDGVMSADPRLVPDAVILNEMSYQEVTELAYFGAKVVHPATMEPAFKKNIPIWIKNTFNPNAPGTKIHVHAKSLQAVKGLSAIENMALLNLEGTGMVGVPGIAERLFSQLRSVGVSVVLISQASSEHSICFAVPNAQAVLAKSAVERAFLSEINEGLIQKIDLINNNSILALVGDNMEKTPGISGRFFTALGNASVNIRAIAQGSSERNISVVIPSADTVKAIRAAHSAFYLSHQTISVGIIGTGLIGSTFLSQLEKQIASLKQDRKIDIRVRAIMNSKTMALVDQGCDLKNWKQSLTQNADVKKFTDFMTSSFYPHAVVIDATASEAMSDHYVEWATLGLHLISPNKKANTKSMSFYNELRTTLRAKNRHFLYSTNVGAGLPILQAIRDLKQTGDKILEVQGIMSGTLSYLFNTYDGTIPFSELLLEAKKLGLTEPDPREDLSGMDVARKLVILARDAGFKIELQDVKVQSLVPAKLQSLSLEEYIKNLNQHDSQMQTLLAEAEKNNSCLRYVGSFNENGFAQVKLENISKAHAFAQATGTENIFKLKTDRYQKYPMIIRGPGAGPEITAGGVFADLLRLATFLGASS